MSKTPTLPRSSHLALSLAFLSAGAAACSDGTSFKGGGSGPELIAVRNAGSTHGEVDAGALSSASADATGSTGKDVDGSGESKGAKRAGAPPELTTNSENAAKKSLSKDPGAEDPESKESGVKEPGTSAGSETGAGPGSRPEVGARVFGKPVAPSFVPLSDDLHSCFATASGGVFRPAADKKVESYSVVGGNLNNTSLFADAPGEPGRLVFLRIQAKNVNASSFSLSDPKAAYCIEMDVKNMNSFTMRIHCEAKVAARVRGKNGNGSRVVRVMCAP